MSENKDTRIVRQYHDITKHSEISVRSSDYSLDFENKPKPFKIYSSLPQEKLPVIFPSPDLNALKANGLLEPETSSSKPLSLEDLAEILYFSAGITRVMKRGSKTKYYMRAASATGALYPIELYVVEKNIKGLEDGVYHFDPGEFTLTRIRSGDYLSDLAAATGFNKYVVSSSATIVFTSLAWRNAWKYQSRSYRHWFWDSGVIASNFLATVISLGFNPTLLLGFIDEKISRLLALEDEREAPVLLAPLSLPLESMEGIKLEAEKEPERIRTEYSRLSKEEVYYPIIWETNKASRLKSQLQVSDWLRLSESIPAAPRSVYGTTQKLERDSPESKSSPPLVEVILQRGSTRSFDRNAAIKYRQLSNVLYFSSRGVPADFLAPGSSLIDTYLIANAVEGLESGAYFFNRERESLQLLKIGGFRGISAYLTLEQQLFGDASVVLFLMARLDPILGYLGNRGYNAAQLEAGVIAGKMYLCAYSQGIGASGSTFYDDAVTEFFSPHAQQKSAMIALGIGVPSYVAKPGKILAGKITREEVLES